MLASIIAHKDLILMVALTVSELLALAVPSSGGIVKSIVNALKALGAKDVDGQ